MSGISLANAQAILDALVQSQVDDPLTSVGSFSIGGRTVSYRSAEDLIALINYWSRTVATLQRTAAGQKGPSRMLPNFSGRTCR